MKARSLRFAILAVFVFLSSQNVGALNGQVGSYQPASQFASVFTHPLGFQDGITYIPRVTYDNSGNLIENTDYGVKNPDLKPRTTCFGNDIPLSATYHAGEDLYYPDRNFDTAGTDVFAAADGRVMVNPPVAKITV